MIAIDVLPIGLILLDSESQIVHTHPCREGSTDALLRMLYGLTPAECRVALLLNDGRTPRGIAELVGVTENTIRSQLKSSYSKTGVGRQAELVRLLLSYAEPRLDA